MCLLIHSIVVNPAISQSAFSFKLKNNTGGTKALINFITLLHKPLLTFERIN
jgi:hypothetical protein